MLVFKEALLLLRGQDGSTYPANLVIYRDTQGAYKVEQFVNKGLPFGFYPDLLPFNFSLRYVENTEKATEEAFSFFLSNAQEYLTDGWKDVVQIEEVYEIY